ncbi:hypothetical protein H1A07_09540 (plasmid) [Lactobacillus taiwanensis]|nr:hypothetical protein H1A07_09540 [Lactobacillus taiwanensis]
MNPDNPDKPVSPDNPDKPVNPDNPDKPVNPDNPDKPVNPDNPTEVPADKIPNGSSKTVNLVTKYGQEVGTATLTKNNNQVSISNIPSGYEVKDTSQLLQWPDKVVVESNGTSNPEVSADKIPNGSSKTVNLVTKDGQEVGTATLTKTNNQVNISNIPSGYEVKDTSQLLQWPDKVVVESNGTSNPEVPADKIPNGSSKTVNLVTKDGQEVGTATLTKNNNQVSISNIPSGYEVKDTSQLLQWPDKVVVESNGTSNTEVPVNKIPNGSSKTVNLVTKDGQEVGTATLTKNNNQVSISNIPSGYEVKDTSQLLQWPDKVVVESNGTSNTEVPVNKIPNGSSKTVNLVTKDGQEVGTATLTKTNNQVNISNIPSDYEVVDTTQLLQWPERVVVVKITQV